MKKGVKITIGVLVVIFVIIPLIGYFIGDPNEDISETKSETSDTTGKIADAQEYKVSEEKKQMNRISNVLYTIKDFKLERYAETVNGVSKAQESIQETALDLPAKSGIKNDTIMEHYKEAKEAYIEFQKEIYPKLREMYFEVVKKKLWEQDVDVTLSGSKNQNLTFTGGIFVKNKNKKDFLESGEEYFHKFRFKNITIQWYDHDDDATSWSLTNKDDGEL